MNDLSKQLLLHESDRGCVLVAHAVLDEAVELLLRGAFSKSEAIMKASVMPMFAVNGPLSTFWSKLHLANSLELLSPAVYTDLEIMRRIRNRFAHQKAPVDFNDKSLVSDLEKLSSTEHYGRLMKGKRYVLKPDNSGKLPSVAQLQENGLLSFHKTCFTWSVGINLTFLHLGTTSVNKGGIIRGRAWAKKWETEQMWKKLPTEK
jgi:DNA-binding MltR family transcriptional regulator